MRGDIDQKVYKSLEEKGAIVNGKPLEHSELIKEGRGFVIRFTNSEREYLGTLRSYETIKATHQKSKDWGEVFSNCVYMDERGSSEAFIDYLEEVTQTKVKDAKHLQELTGITHIKETYIKGKLVKAQNEDQQKEFALKALEETLTGGRVSKYSRAIETALQEGAKYEDLLKIKPQDYGLPKKWKTYKEEDQYSTILDVISWEYLIAEPGGLMLLPSLRLMAKELEAPYSVVMDVYNQRGYRD